MNIFPKYQLPISSVLDGRCLEDSEQKDDLINEWINELFTKVIVEQEIPLGNVKKKKPFKYSKCG